MADELDDNFEVDEPITADDNDEDEFARKQSKKRSTIEHDSGSKSKKAKKVKKSKQEESDEDDEVEEDEDQRGHQTPKLAVTDPAADLLRKQKKKEKLKKWKESKKANDLAVESKLLSGSTDAQAQVVSAAIQLRFKNQLSEMELEDIRLTGDHFVNLAKFSEARELPQLAELVKHIIPDWKYSLADNSVDRKATLKPGEKAKTKDTAKEPKQKGGRVIDNSPLRGRPVLLIVTSAALRATELIRALDEFRSLCIIGKLFAKHFKWEEQAEFLRNQTVRVCVGTPARLNKLISEGALNLEGLKYVIFDVQRDQKGRNLLSDPDGKKDAVEFIVNHCIPLAQSEQLKLALF